jgi:hypothetical protein
MTFFADLSEYTYRESGKREGTRNVGWLDAGEAHPRGAVPPEFLARLWQFCRLPLVRTRGYHACNLCRGRQVGPLSVTREGEALKLGTAEIRVFGPGGAVYAAPDLVYHYVSAHEYRPPDEFIAAVLAGPAPGSEEYRAHLERANLS